MRLRFTVRGMMLLVAIVGMGVYWLGVRPARFRETQRWHRLEARKQVYLPAMSDGRLLGGVMFTPLGHWHIRLAEKYDRAARYPWLPVAPDPPAPR